MPSRQTAHIDKLLTDWGVGYAQETVGMVAPILAPITPVVNQSDLYPVFGTESWRIIDSHATATSEIAEVDWEYSTGSYFCVGHALRHPVPILRDESPPFDEMRDAVELITAQLLLEREQLVINELTSAAVNLDATVVWSASTAAILSDINLGVTAIRKATGQFPDLMVLGLDVFQALQSTTANDLDKIKYTQAPGTPLTEELLSGLLSPPGHRMRVVTSTMYYEDSNKGATATQAALWPAGRVLLAYTGASAVNSYGQAVSNLKRAGFAKLLYWSKAMGSVDGVGFRAPVDETRGTDGVVLVTGRHYYDVVLTGSSSYYQIDVLD